MARSWLSAHTDQAVLSESPQGADRGGRAELCPSCQGQLILQLRAAGSEHGAVQELLPGAIWGRLGRPREGIEAGSWLQPPPSSIRGVPWQRGRQRWLQGELKLWCRGWMWPWDRLCRAGGSAGSAGGRSGAWAGVGEDRAEPSRILPPGTPGGPRVLPMTMLWRGAGWAPAPCEATGSTAGHALCCRRGQQSCWVLAGLLQPPRCRQVGSSGQFIAAFGCYN